MKITLAYRWNGYAPDETIEVDDRTGKQLVNDGKARVALDDADVVDEPIERDGVTIGEAKAYAAEHGITLREAADALRGEPPASTPNEPPATGDTTKEQ